LTFSENGRSINVNPSRLAVVGDSVGGNVVAAVTSLSKERGGHPINFQVLSYPVTDANFDTPSYIRYQKFLTLSPAIIAMMVTTPFSMKSWNSFAAFMSLARRRLGTWLSFDGR
jgi:acetyl esterase/lipase